MENALKELQDKPREKRTAIEQCIVDAALLEEAERDGEIELMEKAAADLEELMDVLIFAQLKMSEMGALWHLEQAPNIPHTGSVTTCKNDSCQKLMKLNRRIDVVLEAKKWQNT
jgi:hypothetical protein